MTIETMEMLQVGLITIGFMADIINVGFRCAIFPQHVRHMGQIDTHNSKGIPEIINQINNCNTD